MSGRALPASLHEDEIPAWQLLRRHVPRLRNVMHRKMEFLDVPEAGPPCFTVGSHSEYPAKIHLRAKDIERLDIYGKYTEKRISAHQLRITSFMRGKDKDFGVSDYWKRKFSEVD